MVVQFPDLLKRLDDERLSECLRIAGEKEYDEIKRQIETEMERRAIIPVPATDGVEGERE